MIDKTVLELVDRLMAENARRVKAEVELESCKGKFALANAKLSEAEKTLLTVREKLVSMEEEMEKEKESTTRSINYWADKATKLEAELKALKEAKDDTGGT